MSPKSIRTIAFIVLLVHGIGHFQGVVGSLGVKFHDGVSYTSWLFKGLNESVNRTICLVMYLVTAILGILTALSFFGILIPTSGWQVLALLTAIFSTVSLCLFPKALAMFFNKAGAVAVNLIIFYSILFNGNWPSALFDD